MPIKQREVKAYTPTKWDSAVDKQWFHDHFQRFVRKGFPLSMFTERFYKRLSLTFGHIAHYNRMGFYSTWFESTQNQLRFLRHTAAYPCYGDPEYTYSDVERDLVNWVASNECIRIIEGLIAQINAETRARELAELNRLQSKYPEQANG